MSRRLLDLASLLRAVGNAGASVVEVRARQPPVYNAEQLKASFKRGETSSIRSKQRAKHSSGELLDSPQVTPPASRLRDSDDQYEHGKVVSNNEDSTKATPDGATDFGSSQEQVSKKESSPANQLSDDLYAQLLRSQRTARMIKAGLETKEGPAKHEQINSLITEPDDSHLVTDRKPRPREHGLDQILSVQNPNNTPFVHAAVNVDVASPRPKEVGATNMHCDRG